jgi:hypothetical protein
MPLKKSRLSSPFERRQKISQTPLFTSPREASTARRNVGARSSPVRRKYAPPASVFQNPREQDATPAASPHRLRLLALFLEMTREYHQRRCISRIFGEASAPRDICSLLASRWAAPPYRSQQHVGADNKHAPGKQHTRRPR